jgi:aspartyl-tRNA(Asn)/glutamyl-tRNA(Gln) amidotransferase subunit C
MSLDSDEVKKIAHLARLEIREQDTSAYAGSLSSILGLVEQMNAVDTGGVTPMAHPLEMGQRLRPDEVTETDQRDNFQAQAPATANGLYLVPRVIE